MLSLGRDKSPDGDVPVPSSPPTPDPDPDGGVSISKGNAIAPAAAPQNRDLSAFTEVGPRGIARWRFMCAPRSDSPAPDTGGGVSVSKDHSMSVPRSTILANYGSLRSIRCFGRDGSPDSGVPVPPSPAKPGPDSYGGVPLLKDHFIAAAKSHQRAQLLMLGMKDLLPKPDYVPPETLPV